MLQYLDIPKDKMFGTEQMGDAWQGRVLPIVPDFKNYNWWICPGFLNFSKDFTVAWIHLEASNPNIRDVLTKCSPIVDHFVFVSHWQFNKYAEERLIPDHKATVIKNAIVPIESHTKPSTETINIVYTSDEARGLNVLIDSLKSIPDKDIKVHVFRNIRGTTIPDDPRIVLRGRVSNDELKEALKEMHIFAYPCTYEEVSCISLIEAMSAGCYCVHSNIAALPETSMNMTHMYEYTHVYPMHVDRFAKELKIAIQNVRNGWDPSLQIELTNNVYSWDKRVEDWVAFSKKIKKDVEAKRISIYE